MTALGSATIDLLDAPPEFPTLPIGEEGPQFEDLLAADGRRLGLSSFADRAALVLIFSSNRCPTAKAYGPRMNELQRAYGPRGAQVVLINSNDPNLYPDESLPRMVERAAEDGYTFPYLVDAGQHVAKAYGATCTFHVFLLDGERRLRYQGRFDNARLPGNITSHDLTNALDAVLAGEEVAVPTTRAFGCGLDFV
jgi:peroxiredoxin